MCGITGFLGEPRSESELGAIVETMADALHHRGPDDLGAFVEPHAGLAFGFRRLSIIDLSPAGHQPMVSASGRFVLIMNGEIYNFPDLRQRLPGEIKLKGRSDSEVLLEHFEAFGVEATLQAASGMFALALWDRKEKVVTLARDRFGEKPLYYGWRNGVFFFASELKAFKSHPQWRGEIDRNALTLLLRHAYIPDPYCIYRGLHKLTPGTFLRIPQNQKIEPENFDPHGSVFADGEHAPKMYWNLISIAEQSQENQFGGNDKEALGALERTLGKAVQAQMISDRPLGAFLSGGTDSSLIVSLMQANASQPVKTFTIGFNEQDFDEATQAKAVAKHLGTDHHELILTTDEAREVIPLLPAMYDEPFADASQMPTYLLARMARKDVTVSLSGDGADELFGGYLRYLSTERTWNTIAKYPKPARRAASALLKNLPEHALNAVLFAPRLLGKNSDKLNAKRAKRAGQFALSSTPHALHLSMLSAWQHPCEVVKQSFEPPTVVNDSSLTPCFGHLYERLMVIDSLSVLPGDMLVKVDRAAMAVSLETRCPFLAPEVAQFAWQLPLHMKIRERTGKWILKELLYQHVPRELVDRPKKGFSVPIRSWLRGPLKEWAGDLLSPERLAKECYFEPEPVAKAFHSHFTGEIDNSHLLWPILMFETWLASN